MPPPSSAAANSGDNASDYSDSDTSAAVDDFVEGLIDDIEEIEESGGGDDGGDDMSISSIGDDDDNNQHDSSKDKDSKGHDKHLGSESSTPEKSRVKLSSSILAIGENSGNSNSCPSFKPLTMQKEESHVTDGNFKYPKSTLSLDNESREPVVIKKDSEASPKTSSKNFTETELQSHLCHSVTKDAPTTVSFSRDGKEVAGAILTREHVSEKSSSVFISEDKTQKIDIQSGNNRKGVTSRLATVTAESPSPGTNLNNGSKRSAIMCDFYAKGWCIKGSSCKFLHVKDDPDNISQQGRDAATGNGKEDAKLKQGVRPRLNFPTGYNNHASIIDKESPRVKDSLIPEYRTSSDFGIPLPNYQSRLRHYGSNFVDMSRVRSQFMANNHLPPALSHSLNPRFGTLKTNGIFPARHMPPWISSSFPPISCSFVSDEERLSSQSAYLLRGYPSFSGLKPERTDLSGEAPYSADNKTNISSDGWEPSVPFWPSFFMTAESASSSGNQYDPLRDSMDLPNTAEKSFKFIFSASGSTTENSLHQRAYGDSTLAGAKVPDGNDDKNSAHVKSHDSMPEKNSDSHGKDSHTSVAETVGTSMVDGKNVTSAEEVKPSLSLNAKDVATSTKINDIKSDSMNQRARQQNEAGMEHITDGEVQKESKVMRYFRASLIDLVKELLKPAWHKGTLSKDAHNLIVKKAADKVLSSLQPHQTVSIESVSQYLSFSRPKISKLVEAYVEKYDKS